MANPDYVNNGTEQASAGAITVNLPPSWSAGQVQLLFVATDGFVPTLSTPSGFVLATDPLGVAAVATTNNGTPGAAESGMAVFWRRTTGTTSTTDPAPVIAAPANGGTVQCCHINTYSNCRSSGTPVHKVATAAVTSATTTINPPTITTTIAGCTVFSLASSAEDDSAFNSWGSTGAASPAGTIDSGWHSGAIGNRCSWAGGRGGFATAGGPHNCTSTFATSTKQAQITFALASVAETTTYGSAAITEDDDTLAAAASGPNTGTAAITEADDLADATGAPVVVGSAAITEDDDTLLAASSQIGTAAITEDDDALAAAGSPVAAGSAAVTEADDTLAAFSTLTGAAAITEDDDTLAASGPSSSFTIGAATVAQRIYLTSPESGTFTTSGITTTAGSTLIVVIARGVWASAATPGPTDSLGNTWTLIAGPNAYANYPISASAVYVATSGSRGAGHTFSAAWGPVGGAGSGAGDEVTISVIEIKPSAPYVGTISYVERDQLSSSATSGPVSTSGPGVILAICMGNGPTGFTHYFTPSSPYAVITAAQGATDNPNGSVQITPAYRVVDGVITGDTVTFTNPAHVEGGQIYMVPLQLAAGAVGTGAATEDDDTLAAIAVLPLGGTAAITEADDTLAAVGAPIAAATAAVTEDDDTIAAAGSPIAAAVAAITEDDDTLSAAASAGSTAGTAAITEDDDTLGAVGAPVASGAAAITEDDDTLAAGAYLVTGTAALTEDDDALAAAGASTIMGSAAITEADDTLAAATAGPPAAPWSEPFADLIAAVDLLVIQRLGGSPVIYQPGGGGPAVQVSGVFDASYLLERGDQHAGLEVVVPAVFLRLADLPTDPEVDDPVLTIQGVTYRVIERRAADFGSVLLALRRA